MTIYVPPAAPMQAPAPAPQQPRQFFTPGLALGIPKAKQPDWAQWAAYQRDRVETAHLIQRTFPRVTAAQPLGVPGPRTWAQQAAYQRDRAELAPLIKPVPLATAALPLGAPIAYTFAQQAAYQQPRFHDRPMLTEIEETLPYFTPGFALGVPPPLPFSQFAALRRDAAQPLQLWPQSPPAPPPGRVPFLATQPPSRARGDDLAILDEVLPGPFTVMAQASIAFRRLQIPAWSRGDDPGILHQALQAFFVPHALLVTRLEFAIGEEAMRFSLELERRMFTLPDDGRVH